MKSSMRFDSKSYGHGLRLRKYVSFEMYLTGITSLGVTGRLDSSSVQVEFAAVSSLFFDMNLHYFLQESHVFI